MKNIILNIQNLFKKQDQYVDWNVYSNHIKDIDDLLWRQQVRMRSLKNCS